MHFSQGDYFDWGYANGEPVEPLFPFGFGLSYTSFAFSALVLSPSVIGSYAWPYQPRLALSRSAAGAALRCAAHSELSLCSVVTAFVLRLLAFGLSMRCNDNKAFCSVRADSSKGLVGANFTVQCTVTNSGALSSAVVVQVYYSPPRSKYVRCVRAALLQPTR